MAYTSQITEMREKNRTFCMKLKLYQCALHADWLGLDTDVILLKRLPSARVGRFVMLLAHFRCRFVCLIFQLLQAEGSRIRSNNCSNIPTHLSCRCNVPHTRTMTKPCTSVLPWTPSLDKFGLKCKLLRVLVSQISCTTSAALFLMSSLEQSVSELKTKHILQSCQKCSIPSWHWLSNE